MTQSKAKKVFLWVNKDAAAASLSSSEQAEKQRIFQFVQNQRVRPAAEKKESTKRKRRVLARSITELGPVAPLESSSLCRRYRPLSIRPTKSAQTSNSTPSQSSPGRKPPQARENAGQKAPSPSASLDQIEHYVFRFRRRHHDIPNTNHIAGSAVDPFSAAPMPLTKNIEVLINYFRTMAVTGSHVDKTEVLPPHLQPARRYAKLRDISLRIIMQDKVEFASLMVIMASRMVHLSRIPLTGLERPEYYMQLALSAVRERMLDFQTRGVSGDNVLVHGIHSLALSDWICQRFEAASTHVRAVKALLHLLDLDDSLDKHIAQGTFNVDQMVSIETGWLPEFPLMFDPGPLGEARMSVVREELGSFISGRLEAVVYPQGPVPDASKLSSAMMSHQVDFLADASSTMDFRLGSGFECALKANVVHPPLASILSDLLDVLTVAKYVWRTPNATREDADWMCTRARAICYRLLAVPAQLPFPETSTVTAKTEALRIALLLVVLRCTNRMSFRSAQPNMRRLQRALSLCSIDTDWSSSGSSSPTRGSDSPHNVSTETYDQNELLLWVLMTGLFSAEGETEELWFLMRATYVAERHLGIKDVDGLKEMMAQYFYSKTRQERSVIVVGLHLSSRS
ncbi:hypothetical protein H2200_003487 [Cladophialophora chaetospira]|uniref:Tachykinin family protein n=1 Tax=Cladophialophora chaetospira TaxID=386627 RepID=A0AA38XHG4_9EURO|nr:hypothetical protein H2200_003487 [Cladophialophora chaetospira]